MLEKTNELILDFDRYKVPEAINDEYRLKRYNVALELPEVLEIDHVDAGDAFYSISVEGRDALVRTISFIDQCNLGDDITLRFTT